MTNVEKELNKDDLAAYKKYDNNQYALIPGFTSQKRFADPRPIKYHSPVNTSKKSVAVNEEKLKTHEQRLQQYGLLPRTMSPGQRHNRQEGSVQTSME